MCLVIADLLDIKTDSGKLRILNVVCDTVTFSRRFTKWNKTIIVTSEAATCDGNLYQVNPRGDNTPHDRRSTDLGQLRQNVN